MNPLIEFIVKKHGGKTVSVSTIVALLTLAIQSDAIDVPVPATRAYVESIVDEKTKGLPYLVRNELSKDLDAHRYLVTCMGQNQLAGSLRRMEDDYRDLVGEPYVHKTCVELETLKSGTAR